MVADVRKTLDKFNVPSRTMCMPAGIGGTSGYPGLETLPCSRQACSKDFSGKRKVPDEIRVSS